MQCLRPWTSNRGTLGTAPAGLERVHMQAVGPEPSASHGPRVFMASPAEENRSYMDERRERTQKCVDEGAKAGMVAALWSAGIVAVPMLAVCRNVPWAKANLNHTAQALIISAAGIAAYFITSEKTILECARKSSWASIEEKRKA